MNKKQEILLWVSGLILSWWIYIRLSAYNEGKMQQYLSNISGLQLKADERYIAFLEDLSGKLNYTIPYLLQYAIPFLIITGLLFMSLRTRRKE